MKLPSLFPLPKNKKFDYQPRYFQEEKDSMTEEKQTMSGLFRKRRHLFNFRKEKIKTSAIRTLIFLILLIGLFFYLLK
ncbi:MAG: hypothetical protein A3H98_03795 [Bacteroidetes bacterium RIFCSPLOWO2_02_FULL_36_8]|nr:MAG: hypothetical protein A3H98_03795 [Bacteroidetes bacterium RIFCSPLOWO2_02_FULL_36_8]OFY68794.1 MAG: hypothetical protein A3G23_03105 [Bacteroidetes bacterium RIFCSPLOWO2_12_FULL_37_12]